MADFVHVEAVHEAYLRLTPLLSVRSRVLHGWADDRVQFGIQSIRGAAQEAMAAAKGEATIAGREPSGAPPPTAAGASSLELADSLRRVEHLHARLTELTSVLVRGVGGLERS